MSKGTIERPTTPRPRVRRWQVAVAATAVVAVSALGVALYASDDESAPVADASDDKSAPVAGPPLELSLGAGDGLASCVVFDVAFLSDMSPAFAGTVTAIDAERVTLRVDQWYAGGDAAEVTLTGNSGAASLIGEIDFRVGGEYLITAAEGLVNYCGFSGEATPKLRAAFDHAFGG